MILEIEFKFFLQEPPALLIRELGHCSQNKLFSQHIFSKAKSQELLLPLALQLAPDNFAGINPQDLKGRVRSITTSKAVRYMLGLKGPKDEKFKKLDIVSKPEVEIEINQQQFELLAPHADKGYIVKNRTIVPCSVNYQGEVFSLEVEFDSIREVNQYQLKPKFLIVEIEVPEQDSEKLIQAVRCGVINLHLPSGDANFRDFNPQEVPVKCQEDYADLMASRKLVKNVTTQGPTEYLRKFFDE